jgi:hypothetical protein
MRLRWEENMAPGAIARVWFSGYELTGGPAEVDRDIPAPLIWPNLVPTGKAGVAGPFEAVQSRQPDGVRL